jgi:hypothetical protein
MLEVLKVFDLNNDLEMGEGSAAPLGRDDLPLLLASLVDTVEGTKNI